MRRIGPLLLRFYRAGILIALGFLIYTQGRWFSQQRPVTISLLQARRFFPTAERLTLRDPERALYYATDRQGAVLGCLLTTSPQTDDIIGYSGPNNLLAVLDDKGTLIGLELLTSKDTHEHVKLIRQQPGISAPLPRLETRRGSSSQNCGRQRRNIDAALPSPKPRKKDWPDQPPPCASRIRSRSRTFGHSFPPPPALRTKAGAGKSSRPTGICSVTQFGTSPEADNVGGYRGPTEALVVLQPDGGTVHTVLIRHSYDTESYVKQVRTDSQLLKNFQGRSTESLAAAKGEKIQGVSGATQTSWAHHGRNSAPVRQRFAAAKGRLELETAGARLGHLGQSCWVR